MKNIKISAFLTTIIAILLFDIGCCLAESTRSSDLEFTKEEYEDNQQIALDRRRVSLVQEESNRLVHNSNVEIQLLLNAQRRALIAQETKQKMDPLNIEVEAQVSKAENTFRLCLVKNIDNFDLGSFGIPKICEDSAKALRLLGYRSLVNELTEEFQK